MAHLQMPRVLVFNGVVGRSRFLDEENGAGSVARLEAALARIAAAARNRAELPAPVDSGGPDGGPDLGAVAARLDGIIGRLREALGPIAGSGAGSGQSDREGGRDGLGDDQA